MTRTVQELEAIGDILVDKVKHLDEIIENVLETKIRHSEVKERDTEQKIVSLSKKKRFKKIYIKKMLIVLYNQMQRL